MMDSAQRLVRFRKGCWKQYRVAEIVARYGSGPWKVLREDMSAETTTIEVLSARSGEETFGSHLFEPFPEQKQVVGN